LEPVEIFYSSKYPIIFINEILKYLKNGAYYPQKGYICGKYAPLE